MEPQQNMVESVIAPLKKVTPLSKYLAMVLFIILPFLGGYIGYTLAPEKVVEVEKVISKDVAIESMESTSPDLVDSEPVKTSEGSTVSVSFQKVAGWMTYSSTEGQRMEGTATLFNQNQGSVVLGTETIYTHESGLDPTRVEIKKINDTIDNVASQLSEDQMFSTTTSEYIELPGEYTQEKLLKLTRSVTTNDCKWLTYLHRITPSTTGAVEIATCPTHNEGYDATKIMVAESVKFSLSQ